MEYWHARIRVVSSSEHGLSNTRLLREHCLVDTAGQLPTLGQLGELFGLVRVGVHAAREIDAPAAAGAALARNQPVYVPRDIDEELNGAIAAGGLVLVLGDSTAGKSR